VSTLAIVLIVLGALLLLLFIGGLAANARVRRARAADLQRQVGVADQALAAVRAGDRGWDLAVLESAARQAYASRFDGREPERLYLVQVVDRPGTDADECVFRAIHGHHESDVVLGREGGQWVAR
jgi:type II secretory pathway pseudopilin PulG